MLTLRDRSGRDQIQPAPGVTPATTNYDAGDITVLEGLEAVRRRPGMYIGSTGPRGLHHLVYEVVDNSVDEALAGYCDRVEITLNPDGSCTVADNGRGIPVAPMADQGGKSALEVVMTVLHAGGKFGGDGYKVSGGLHGVGISVVNALSESLTAEVHRDGGVWVQRFAAGEPAGRGRARRRRHRHRHHHHLPARPRHLRGAGLRLRDAGPAPARDGLPHQGPGGAPGRPPRRGPRGRVPLRGRHPRLRQPPQRDPRPAAPRRRLPGGRRPRRASSRSRCSGRPHTARPSTPSRTTSTPTRAAPTSPASARR